jgi:SAM-dependent methyltransferase
MVRGVQYLPCEAEFDTDNGIDMAIYVDVNGMVEVFDMQVVYSEGVTSASAFSPMLMKHRHEQIEEFMQRFDLIGKKVLEVGTGDGHVMSIISELGSLVFGIEPSSKMAELAIAKGFNVVHGFMSQSNRLPAGPFDAFVSFHVMEHIPDLGDFVRGIRENLVPGGVGLIEVPSLEHTLEGNFFYEFFPDHLNYFSLRTLRLTLELHGFEVIETRRAMNGAHNVAYVRRLEPLSLDRANRSLKETVTSVQHLVYKNVDQGRRIALWGASCHAMVLLSQSESLPITYIVDRAPFKQGLFTPVTHLPIVAPEMLVTDPVDTLLIIAPCYEQEILNDIQEMGYGGSIFTLRGSSLTELTLH